MRVAASSCRSAWSSAFISSASVWRATNPRHAACISVAAAVLLEPGKGGGTSSSLSSSEPSIFMCFVFLSSDVSGGVSTSLPATTAASSSKCTSNSSPAFTPTGTLTSMSFPFGISTSIKSPGTTPSGHGTIALRLSVRGDVLSASCSGMPARGSSALPARSNVQSTDESPITPSWLDSVSMSATATWFTECTTSPFWIPTLCAAPPGSTALT